MPILHDFEFQRPRSISEALKILAKNKNSKVLAGGTDLVGHLKEELGSLPDVVVDIKGVSDVKKLKTIEMKAGKFFIGSLVTFSEMIDSRLVQSKFPILMEVSNAVASVGVRNRATMVGNICSAVPCMDSGPLLVALDAQIVVKSTKGERKILAKDWFKGPRKTALKPGELVLGILFPMPKKHGAAYVKLGRYNGEDLAQASVLVVAEEKNIYKVAYGSVGPVPIRGKKVESILNGTEADASVLSSALDAIGIEISPISDIRSSKEYRLHMTKVMFERGLRAAKERLMGKGPAYGKALV